MPEIDQILIPHSQYFKIRPKSIISEVTKVGDDCPPLPPFSYFSETTLNRVKKCDLSLTVIFASPLGTGLYVENMFIHLVIKGLSIIQKKIKKYLLKLNLLKKNSWSLYLFHYSEKIYSVTSKIDLIQSVIYLVLYCLIQKMKYQRNNIALCFYAYLM